MDRKSTKNTFPSMKNLYFKSSALVPKNLVFQKKKKYCKLMEELRWLKATSNSELFSETQWNEARSSYVLSKLWDCLSSFSENWRLASKAFLGRSEAPFPLLQKWASQAALVKVCWVCQGDNSSNRERAPDAFQMSMGTFVSEVTRVLSLDKKKA